MRALQMDEEQKLIGEPKENAHTDGTLCFEGTKMIPENFKPCCDTFESHVKTCIYDLRFEWWDKRKSWFIMLSDGSGIKIDFCPHCGTKF